MKKKLKLHKEKKSHQENYILKIGPNFIGLYFKNYLKMTKLKALHCE